METRKSDEVFHSAKVGSQFHSAGLMHRNEPVSDGNTPQSHNEAVPPKCDDDKVLEEPSDLDEMFLATIWRRRLKVISYAQGEKMKYCHHQDVAAISPEPAAIGDMRMDEDTSNISLFKRKAGDEDSSEADEDEHGVDVDFKAKKKEKQWRRKQKKKVRMDEWKQAAGLERAPHQSLSRR